MRSPLLVSLLGPMGDVPFGRNITLDAGRSADPDNPAASLDYRFTCSPQPCFVNDTYRGERRCAKRMRAHACLRPPDTQPRHAPATPLTCRARRCLPRAIT